MERVATVDDSEWTNVSEAARRLGISRTAIRGRIERNTVEHRLDNQGRPTVRVPLAKGGTLSHGPHGGGRQGPDGTPPHGPDGTGHPETRQTGADRLVSLDDVRLLLGEQSARLERQHAAAMAAALSAVERSHRATLEMMTERVDRAELIVERLLDAHRPFWSRWFGKSKTSDL